MALCNFFKTNKKEQSNNHAFNHKNPKNTVFLVKPAGTIHSKETMKS